MARIVNQRIGLFLLLCLLATSCGAPADDSVATAPEITTPEATAFVAEDTSPSADRLPVRIAVPGTVLGSPIWVAESLRLFDAAGLDATIVSVTDENEALTLIRNGEADLASVFMYDIPFALASGSNELVVTKELYGAGRALEFVDNSQGTLRLHIGTDTTVSHPCDLEGLEIGLPATTSVLLLGFRRLMDTSSCDADAVTIRFLDDDDRLNALLDGSVQAAAFVEPWSSEVEFAGITESISLDGSLCRRCALGVIATSRGWAEANGDTIDRVHTALDEALAIADTDEVKFRSLLVSCCALPVDRAATISIPVWTTDDIELEATMDDLLAAMRDEGARLGSLSGEDLLLSTE